MIGLIRALLGKPAVLIVDEGFNALDPEAFAQAVRLVTTMPVRKRCCSSPTSSS